MKNLLLTKGQLVKVYLEEAGLDENWRLWFKPRGCHSMLDVFDQVCGTIIECHPGDSLSLSLFSLAGKPAQQAILKIPWQKIRKIKCAFLFWWF